MRRLFPRCRDLLPQLVCLLAMVAAAPAQTAQSAAPAQTAQSAAPAQTGVPNALQGFSKNRDQPVKIESASFEVRDKDKVATFSGDVHVTQGDTTLKCKTLVVFYESSSRSPTVKAAQPGPGGQQQISRLEAKGGVTVNQKDQTARGSTGVYDMKTNTVMLSGDVVLTQGQNVVRGDRLVVDLTSGVSRVEGGRVQGLFLPHSQRDTSAPAEKERARPAAPGSTGPLRLN